MTGYMALDPLPILRLTRVHTAAASAAVPAAAVVALGGEPLLAIGVFFAVVLHHIWGFSLNEVMDLEVDRRSGIHSDKPLVSGAVTLCQARIIVLVSLISSYLLFLAMAFINGSNITVVLFPLTLSTLMGYIYDAYGKRFPLSDVFVGGWMFLLVLSAGTLVDGDIPGDAVIWGIGALIFLHLVFNNSVEGGLKDAVTDRRSGVRSVAVLSGVREEKGWLILPAGFRVWGIGLRIAFCSLIPALFHVLSPSSEPYTTLTIFVAVLSIALFACSLSFLERRIRYDRLQLLGAFSKHEMASFLLSIVAILPAIGLLAGALLFLIPVVWFVVFNRLMYRTSIKPAV